MSDATDTEPTTGFAALGLDPRLVEALTALGYEEPTPIQSEAIPPILQGRDLVGLAATGTGKTAAFALPLLHRVTSNPGGGRPAALVLVPTRELAMQVAEAIHKYGRPVGSSVLPVYGGQAYDRQLRALRRGTDVIVATPGRALDLIRRGSLPLAGVRVVVLDEADEMLDMGFAEDIEAILADTPADRQTMLFSATMPPRIEALAGRHLKSPVRIEVARGPVTAGEGPKVRQTAYVVARPYKLAALARILDVESPAAALVFCRMRTEVDELTEALAARGYRPAALHGGMTQEQRDRVMRQVRDQSSDLLIATDVAARGLDIGHLTHVINFHVPNAADAYVHRIGRVGRAGRAGVAITLAEPREHRMLREIERETGQKIEIGRLPTVADVRARRLELTRTALREAILEGGLDEFRVVVESLGSEFDAMEIALAGAKLVHKAEAVEGTDEEIPAAMPDRGPPQRGKPGPRGRPARGHGPGPGLARLFVSAGREAGVSVRDLVGVIANQAGLGGRDIGTINVADRFSLVEVPEEVADYVIECLQGARLKGRKVMVRRDRRD